MEVLLHLEPPIAPFSKQLEGVSFFEGTLSVVLKEAKGNPPHVGRPPRKGHILEVFAGVLQALQGSRSDWAKAWVSTEGLECTQV